MNASRTKKPQFRLLRFEKPAATMTSMPLVPRQTLTQWVYDVRFKMDWQNYESLRDWVDLQEMVTRIEDLYDRNPIAYAQAVTYVRQKCGAR